MLCHLDVRLTKTCRTRSQCNHVFMNTISTGQTVSIHALSDILYQNTRERNHKQVFNVPSITDT